jgi:SecD/SecF fusion protein
MNTNLMLKAKALIIIALVFVAAWTLYPPNKTLKPGIDLAGGTSLIYEIDTHGMEESEKKDLAQRMITVLRRRIDPANIQNLIWRPQGSTRFEIQMPLASAEARQKRANYETAEEKLLDKNVSRARIMRSLDKTPEERLKAFNDFAKGDPNRLKILTNLAAAYDERTDLRNARDKFITELETTENQISSAGMKLEQVKLLVGDWIKLNEEKLQEALGQFADANDSRELLTGYVKTYAEWSKIANQLDEKNTKYKEARKAIDQLNLTKDQLDTCLEKPAKSKERQAVIEKLKTDFPDRKNEIDAVASAFDEYRPFRGRLDDPQDLRRMLKGAGILEFRILPTQGHPEVDMDEMATYIEAIREKGPKYASDNKYVWCEIEGIDEWRAVDGEQRPAFVAQFGDKYYVLASNKPDEAMLHSLNRKNWKLDRSYPTTDNMGRRAIGFLLDDRGGRLFSNITRKNLERPLCILLDGMAISAPSISEKIRRQGIIRGSFTSIEVDDMVNKLNAGSLPARLIEQPISVNTIGPSIGANNRDEGIRAGLIGLAAVIICMAVYYCLAGSIADVALLLNIFFVLAIMAGTRATFTLPGIAGLILTIGMSVDANVLIFERIREEQQKGQSLRIAIEEGYPRAYKAIIDANVTTFITAAILYWLASEEVKGFAIVLMLGIASSMFTALFVTRVIFDFLLSHKIIKNHLFMLRLIHKPNVNWMRSRPIFFSISIILIAGGLLVFFTRDDVNNNKYDIEFTGGTSARISLKEEMSRQEVEDRIRLTLPAASVYSIGKSGKEYEISTSETNKITVIVTLPQASQKSTDEVTFSINKAQEQFASRLNNLLVTQDTNNAAKFAISTSQMNQSLVKDVLTSAFEDANISEPQVDETVNSAILATFADQLEIQQNLEPKIAAEEKITEELIDSHPELIDFKDGIKIECEIEKETTLSKIDKRFKLLRQKSNLYNFTWNEDYSIFGRNLDTTDPNQLVQSFIYVSADPEASIRKLSEDEWTRFVENERAKVLAATSLETSLPRVRQFDPSIGAEQKTQALIAIILSLSAIIAYIWIRFGGIIYGIGAIVALVHDVCITLGAVTACTYIAGTSIGNVLLIGDFKINLPMIAALLTVIGYSLNDTVVVFDRIRENLFPGTRAWYRTFTRKEVLRPTPINNGINLSMSRTILTSFTTFIVVLIMYIFGGPGLRGFTFAIGFGVIIGTYSSIAIAAPILLLFPTSSKDGKKNRKDNTKTKKTNRNK